MPQLGCIGLGLMGLSMARRLHNILAARGMDAPGAPVSGDERGTSEELLPFYQSLSPKV